MTKRIILLTQYFPPEMGAPQTRLFELCQGLKKRGWNVEVITAMPNYPQGKISPGYKWKIYWKEELQGILLHRYW
ncbi:MAG: glycosyltransferase WbuB, partial [Saprospiraceae bacterium]|nr:glycosyltransferase WbuB [Saprospiraceae bacterium]